MKRFFAAMLCLALAFAAACGGRGDEIPIYRAVAPYSRTDGELIRAESVPVTRGLNPVNAAMAGFNMRTEIPDLVNPLPEDTLILGYELSGGTLRLSVSSGYAGLTGIEKTIADSCIALTFCRVEGVSYVLVFSDGEKLSQTLSDDNVILKDIY